MSYTVHQLAQIAAISVRTLHYYDEIGLLSPARIEKNGYRMYEHAELLKLQQILFFRELDFPIADIKKIVCNPQFDISQALKDQRALIELKKKRLTILLKTIDTTLVSVSSSKKQTIFMTDKDLYQGLSTAELDAYASEAKERWGNTAAYKQSQERYEKLSEKEKAAIQTQATELMKKIAAHYSQDPESHGTAPVQKLIDQHYNNLRHYYEPSIEIYKSLADMYVADPRFTAYFEKCAPGLAGFMQKAMHVYCDNQK